MFRQKRFSVVAAGTGWRRRISTDHKIFEIRRVLVANRGEIAVRIFRALAEMKIESVGVYSWEDRSNVHRMKADSAFLIGKHFQPIAAYMSVPKIISICKNAEVDALHPGYGFLSEDDRFAREVIANGFKFIGPTPDIMQLFKNKLRAKQVAEEAGVEAIPTIEANSVESIYDFIDKVGLPVILKPVYGNNGIGLNLIESKSHVDETFYAAKSEALANFSNDSLMLEKYIVRPKLIEVQILGDNYGNIIHLFDRDCTVQRKLRSYIQCAPVANVNVKVREAIIEASLKIAKHIGFTNCGTMEFLFDEDERFYFLEGNARLQSEHTVTEEVTRIDIVHQQIRLAQGYSLEDLGLIQENIKPNGYAIQAKITTEDPSNNFAPSFGRIGRYWTGVGMGIRLDGGLDYVGAVASPYYEPTLVKVISHSNSLEESATKLCRSLREFRIQGVRTNIPFLLNVLNHPKFLEGSVDAYFIDRNPTMFTYKHSSRQSQRLVNYLGHLLVNKPPDSHNIPTDITLTLPDYPRGDSLPPDGLRQILQQDGPDAFVKAVRASKALLLMDTTYRDAVQTLLMSRVRTYDILKVCPFVARYFPMLYSIEMLGGTHFNTMIRYLKESPWERLESMRKLIPNIPFQLIMRGYNSVGYTRCPENVIYKFCEEASILGIDIFRIHDPMNYLPGMMTAIDAVGKAGGVIETCIVYSGNIMVENSKYDLKYYLKLTDDIVKAGTHALVIKDVAGTLTPAAGQLLVKAIRDKYPELVIHVHTHDTTGCGVATLLACAAVDADVVDVAVDSLSGGTSNPAMGAVVASLQGTPRDTKLNLRHVSKYSTYWEQVRPFYAAYDVTNIVKTGNVDVFECQMPGAQYSILLYQLNSLGLMHQFVPLKSRYIEANKLLGDIVKSGQSAKAVSDLAKFMLRYRLTSEKIFAEAETLAFPRKVVEYFQGYIGQPFGGFPEPLRSMVLKNMPKIDSGRPGYELQPVNFDEIREDLKASFDSNMVTEEIVCAAALYPGVVREYLTFLTTYGPTRFLETRVFFQGPKIGEELIVELEPGYIITIKALAVSDEISPDGKREVFFEVNGALQSVYITDKWTTTETHMHPKVNPRNFNEVGTPISGIVTEIVAKPGDYVEKGWPLVILSALEMETIIQAPHNGVVQEIYAKQNMELEVGDLIILMELK